MQLRAATIDDAAAIRGIYEAAIAAVSEKFYTAEQKYRWSVRRSAAEYRALLEAGNETFWVGEIDATVVAFTSLIGDEMKMLYVHPQHQRRGYSRLLYEKVLAEARARGLTQLTVHASRNAVAVYEALGFQSVRCETVRLVDGLEIGCVLMRSAL